MEVKDNRKRSVYQIKIFAAQKAVQYDYDSDASLRVTLNKKSRTGVLLVRNQHAKNTLKHKYSECYLILCKKSVVPECKYKQHSL